MELFVLVSSQGTSPFGWPRAMVDIVISSGKSWLTTLLLTISLFLRSRRSCIRVTLGWDFRSGLISGSLLLDTFDPDGSGFHLFIKDSVSLSREEVDIEEEEEIAVDTEETTVEDGEKVVVEAWGENATGVEENTLVEEERVEVEEEKEEKEEEGVVVLGPASCVFTRLLMERSMGEQLE